MKLWDWYTSSAICVGSVCYASCFFCFFCCMSPFLSLAYKYLLYKFAENLLLQIAYEKFDFNIIIPVGDESCRLEQIGFVVLGR